MRKSLTLLLLLSLAAVAAEAKVADKKFWITVGGLGVAKAFDAGTTARYTPSCVETNPLLGPYPSTRRVIAVNSGYFAGEVALAYVLKRVFRRHRWLGKAWTIEPVVQGTRHIYFGARNIAEGCT